MTLKDIMPGVENPLPLELEIGGRQMQFLVLAKASPVAFKDGMPADFKEVAAGDSAYAQKAYLDGAIRQMWNREAGHGPAAIVEAGSAEEAQALFATWPLFKVGYLELEVFALHPYHGFAGG